MLGWLSVVVSLYYSVARGWVDATWSDGVSLPLGLETDHPHRFLLGKFADMQTFAGESMTAEGGMAFGYYKEGAHNPTFAYISKAMEAEKVRSVVDIGTLRPGGRFADSPVESSEDARPCGLRVALLLLT